MGQPQTQPHQSQARPLRHVVRFPSLSLTLPPSAHAIVMGTLTYSPPSQMQNDLSVLFTAAPVSQARCKSGGGGRGGGRGVLNIRSLCLPPT
ncbi:hypothetical protein SAMD00023353_2900680 [Rosellinia necatrix]|uniref:Uncharacterized protein n=1 Tax=Rosellinia necatrix TaxID=77044 RepID=A0A1S8A8I2_ROSNE|nr:hypothetical protein SAMD00023353_2900680 [Rosellinia necatrix]